jgi:hypothetical protein
VEREKIVRAVMVGSVVLGVLSLIGAHVIHCCLGENSAAGYVLVAFWSLAPPLWFFFEWVLLCPALPEAERTRIQHSHDLGRNVWIAYVIVLAVLADIKWPGST